MPRKINLQREKNETVYLQNGKGIFDIFSKTVIDTGKKVLPKAIEKGALVAAEKIGNKTGQLIGEKIYDRFTSAETITKELQKKSGKTVETSNQIDSDLKNMFNKIITN